MPARMIKPSICSSKTIDALSCEAERCFYRLLTHADDWGLYEADPVLVRANCFPRKLDAVSEADVAEWLREMESVGLSAHYESHGRRYGQFVRFRHHNTTRAKKPKFPLPPDSSVSDSVSVSVSVSGDICKHVHADECTCMQINADASTPPSPKEIELSGKPRILLDDWNWLYAEHMGRSYHATWKDHQTATHMAKQFDRDGHRAICVKYLECDDKYVMERGHPYPLLPHRINALLASEDSAPAQPEYIMACPACYDTACSPESPKCSAPREQEKYTPAQLEALQ